ncbi:F0F1 ATP synthase subunit I [Pandoraea cepalis]|uniref:ATP synthase subunit I n=1 Tax=Pandoraea cepalis TaxID=2508294 RepID=A0A5E4R986_9BURK|nr:MULTISPECIES: ATP synthase subunit I [Pandoraea]MDN4576329.1 F0F1 ATP synthase subunit I [Pandoraea cepalis]MDN4578741.1 F0F1 ATP synthase subunit I [Pandoraea cepalis]QBC33582.1 ATP synthase subunit I [Pandoraea sp. XY-2]VVD59301.1 ATP synthase subunit I [Pandoraea cepalis]
MTDEKRSNLEPKPQAPARAASEVWDDEQAQETIVPLTRAQAERLFGPDVGRVSRVTPFRVVGAQVLLSLVAALAWWLLSASPRDAAVSAWLGGMIGWLPGALFALRLRMSGDRLSVGSLMVGEAVKVATTIALFVAIAFGYPGVHWIALLVTFVLTLKVYWLAMALK